MVQIQKEILKFDFFCAGWGGCAKFDNVLYIKILSIILVRFSYTDAFKIQDGCNLKNKCIIVIFDVVVIMKKYKTSYNKLQDGACSSQ